MPRRLKGALFTLAVMAVTTGKIDAAEKFRPTVRLKFGTSTLEGTPLLSTKSNVAFLTRDGRLWLFDPKDAREAKKVAGPFRGFSTTVMRRALENEFGRGFQVTSAGRYLVVHPRGHGGQWSRRFEELYRSFGMYFSVRGFRLETSQFPLVAVVLRTHEEFLRYARRERGQVPSDVLGYYSPRSNRVILYDVTGGQQEDAWFRNAETIIHEATHQTAFNCGIHSRFCPPPLWVAEGLGTMFEARGVWDARHSARSKDRINRDQLQRFQRYLPRRKPDALSDLISSDRRFRTDVEGAYAESWALTYFLSETRPRKYVEYLRKTAAHGDFQRITATQRQADFTAMFGDNLKLLDAQFVAFMKGVK